METNILLPSVGCLGFLFVFGLVFTAARRKGVAASKAGSSYSLREMAGELTAAEMAEDRRADKRTHNENARSNAFWTGSDTYIDADGRRRNL